MQRKKVLVTGGTGFIGSSLVRGLLEKGYQVKVFDNNYRGKMNNIKDIARQVEFVEGDIRIFDNVLRAVKGCQIVYHLAFINGTENFYKHPDLVLEVGVKGHLNMLDAIVQTREVETFIYASSSEIYQVPDHIPTTEKIRGIVPDVHNPRYSYGGSKLMGELLTLHYLKAPTVKRVIFRPHNIYGPAMGFEHVIPQIVKKIIDASDGLRRQSVNIEIQGSGEETRAFCYVKDAIEGIILSAERGKDGEIYNVGKEEEIKIIDLVRKIGIAMGIELTISHTHLLMGSTPRRCPDVSKLKTLGYQPATSLKAGIQASVDWYQSYYLKNLVSNSTHGLQITS